VETAGRKARRDLLALLHKHRIEAYDLSDNEMAKLHVRHLVAAMRPAAENEILYRFEFPERPAR
jgi:threonine dehydratase